MEKLLMIEFKYEITKKNHFKSLLKNQLKTISFFLFIFTFCYFGINLEAFLYNFPYNVKLVLITYIIYLIIIFAIMFLISIIYSLIMSHLFKKNNLYKLYNYKIENNKLMEKNSNYIIDLNVVKRIIIKKNYIKFISFKLKEIITFEKNNFINKDDFEKLKKFLKNK